MFELLVDIIRDLVGIPPDFIWDRGKLNSNQLLSLKDMGGLGGILTVSRNA